MRAVMEVHEGIDHLSEIAEEWNDLPGPALHPLVRHEWYAACARCLHEPDELRVATVRNGGRLMAAAGLVARQRTGVEWWEFMGANVLGEPCDVVYRDTSSLDQLLNGLVRARHPILLSRVPAESDTLRAVGRIRLRRAGSVVRRMAPSRFVPVQGTWSEFERRLPPRRRYDLRRARRRAAGFGDLETEIVRPTPEAYDERLRDLAAVEGSGWKGGGGSALNQRAAMRDFFRTVGAEAAKDRRCLMSFLRVAGEIAAAQLALEWANRLWVLKIGYDERFARCSPGIQLTHATIRYAFDHGLGGYEFLGFDEPWLEMWRPAARNFAVAVLYPANGRGAWALANDTARFLFSRLSRNLQRGNTRRGGGGSGRRRAGIAS